MHAAELISRFEAMAPGFRQYVESEANVFFRDSLHGVFAACSHFLCEQAVPLGTWKSFAEFVNGIVGAGDGELDNAACTCFLENLATESHPLGRFLEGEALAFWRPCCA